MSLNPRQLTVRAPRVARREPGWRRAARRYWPLGVAGTGALGWYAADSLRHRREGAFGYEIATEIDVGSEEFTRAAEALTGAPITTGNHAELLINGDRIFPAFLGTVRSAERTLNVQTYVYWRGEIADDVAGAIAEKAGQGVRCKVILDALGAAQMDRRRIAEMRDAGAEVLLFRPPKPYAIKRIANRTHRRALIADGRVGMTGGVGIAAEWMGDAEDSEHWRDTHVRVRGPVVRGLQGAFAENWLEGTGEVLAGEDYLPDLEPVDGGGRMQLIRSSAKVGDTNAEALYYLAIASAQRSIELTAAYFVPRPAFTQALCDAAERGVDVRVLVPGPHIDKGFVRAGGRASYQRLLARGPAVRVPADDAAREDAGRRRHMVVRGDGQFDNRSSSCTTRSRWGLGRAFAGQLHEAFERDLERADEIERERWRRRAASQRLSEAATTVLRREL